MPKKGLQSDVKAAKNKVWDWDVPQAFKHKLAPICLQAGCGLVSCPAPAFNHKLASIRLKADAGQAHIGLHLPSSWLRAGVPHQLSITSCPPSGVPHQLASSSPAGSSSPQSWCTLSSTSWPRATLKLQAGVPHQLSSTSCFQAQAALKAGVGHQPAASLKANRGQLVLEWCGLVSRTSFEGCLS